MRQKNGADPTEAAPDQTNRGAGLVKIPASRSRDSACPQVAGTGVRLEGLRYDLRWEGELKSSCMCFSLSCSAEAPSIFCSFCLFPGGTPPIVHSPNVDASVLLFADLLSSNPVREGLPRTGVRDRRGLDQTELITVLVKVREKCCHQTDSYLYLLRERD